MDSLLAEMKPETREEEIVCPKHGTRTVKQIKLFYDWLPPRCPVCKADQAAADLAQEQARKERDRAEADRKLIRDLFSQAAIPQRFENRTFANYIIPQGGDPAINAQMEKARNICLDYAANFPDRLTKGTSMIFCGNTGTGKTHLACAIANHVIAEHRRSAVYMTVGRAFRTVKETYAKNTDRSENQTIEAFRLPDLLILDEIGVQYGSDTEKNILFEIINERYESLKPTILISNLAFTSLREYAGDRVLDRMKENGGMAIVFDWKSRRSSCD